ncbi:MAG: translation initiation factor IF-2 subunit beta [Candidatus Micrarchaeota archaeon]|nr:translation initiation factor IF-2 subunit beta [Candidatus Micrarchaeota archaeon]MDE1846527.1 translation initiation factor IF-2 subunit beta [Candidatus Micrarchaeota archaeon]
MVFLLDSNYEKLLDRAFSKLPTLSAENVDFKIPAADSIIQGAKTIVRNFGQIADVARRDKTDIAKYITKELAAPVSIEEQRLVISAKVTGDVINTKVKKYFDTYVICKECHKPDTHIESSTRGFLTIVCEACGARYTIKHY